MKKLVLHRNISYIKSILRLVGCLMLWKGPTLEITLCGAALFLGVAEILGIAEEAVL